MKQEDFDSLDIGGFFNSLFEHASVNGMILMTMEGIVISVNQAFTTLFGYQEKDLVNKHFSILFNKKDRESGKPERELQTVKTKGSGKDRNFILHANGNEIWASGESILVNNRKGDAFMVKVVQDLHEQKLLENFLSQSNELQENILMTISDALILIDVNNIVLKVNTAFTELFETTAESFERIPLGKTEHPFWDDKTMQDMAAAILKGNEYLYKQSFYFKRKNGKKRIISVSSKLLSDMALSKAVVLFSIQDVTESKLNDKRRKDMIGFISHELRNPLTRLGLATQMIKEVLHQKDFPELNNYIRIAETVSSQLNGLVSELHDATKAGYHKLQMSKSHFPYDGFIHETIEAMQLSWPGIRIVKQGSAGLMVYADKQRLEQVLNNYVSNAIKYAGADKEIIISVEAKEGNVVTCVKDYGPGIKPENLRHLFKRLYRASDEKTEGLGLGLYLSRQIVKAHNGNVWVESEEGKGAAFYFSLPLKSMQPG